MFDVTEVHKKSARKEINLNFRVDPITGEKLAMYCNAHQLHQSALLRELVKQFLTQIEGK